jgi:hypothetical protein
LVLVEDAMDGVCVVVTSDTGMVMADDEMGTAEVLSDDCVENRFSRPGVAHPGGVGGQEQSVREAIIGQERFIAVHAHVGGNVIILGLAHQRVQEQTVRAFPGHVVEALMSAVDRVAGLETDHGPPAALGDCRPNSAGGEIVGGEGRRRPG